MAPINTFEDLECYKAAREFRTVIVEWAKRLPSEEKYRLVDQTIRAVRSITANIAEGFGRQHPQENLQFCRQARGSLMEVLEHLNTAADEKLLPEEQYQHFREKWNKVMRDSLVESQSKNGHEVGSWFARGGDHGSDVGGRIYCTAMSTMILEVYYRHMPIYGKQAAEEDFPL